MIATLNSVLERLRAHENELRRLGVAHAAVFGSVARGEARTGSDIDVLVELDRNRPIGIFEYARLKLYINEILDGGGDVVNRKTLKPLLRDSILRDAVNALLIIRLSACFGCVAQCGSGRVGNICAAQTNRVVARRRIAATERRPASSYARGL